MADNVELNAGSGGAVMAADEISAVHHQLVKMEYGADGEATMVCAASPLPVAARLGTDAIINGSSSLTPKFAKIGCAASGDNQLVAPVTGRKIRVLSIVLFGLSTVSAYFKSGDGNPICGDATYKIALDNTGATGPGGFVLGFNPIGWFQTGAGYALLLNLSAAVGVCGALTYIEVD
jgi:hypothetical protein